MVQSDLFPDKYFPKNFNEFIGNVEIVDRAIAWANDWKEDNSSLGKEGKKQKPLFFFGNPGVGKTALAVLLAKEMGWQLFEMNASDLRDKESIEKIAGAATANSSLFGAKRLILLDEIDGLQAQDRGGAGAILSIIKGANNPVILIANDAYDKKLASIRPACEALEFKKINYLSIAKRLREICTIEGIEFEDEAIKDIARNCAGDMRSALLDVQSVSPKITSQNVKLISNRERKEKIFPVVSKIFKGKTISEIREAVDSSDTSVDLLLLWVEENIPKQFDSIDAANAFSSLSRADIFNGRIQNRQHWGFLKYSIFLSTVGVGLSRRKDYNFFQPMAFPTILSSLSKSSSVREMRKGIASKIGEKTHSSRKQALADLVFVTELIKNENNSKDFIHFFNFDESEVAFLLGKKADDKIVVDLVKGAKEIEKKIVLEKIHGKQSTLFG